MESSSAPTSTLQPFSWKIKTFLSAERCVQQREHGSQDVQGCASFPFGTVRFCDWFFKLPPVRNSAPVLLADGWFHKACPPTCPCQSLEGTALVWAEMPVPCELARGSFSPLTHLSPRGGESCTCEWKCRDRRYPPSPLSGHSPRQPLEASLLSDSQLPEKLKGRPLGECRGGLWKPIQARTEGRH